MAERVVRAVIRGVPSYDDPFRSGMGARIEQAVRVALDGFVDLAARAGATGGRPAGGGPQLQQVRDAAYALGQGEARAGRSIEALTSAYGVGARAAWRDIGAGAIAAGLPAVDVAHLAELVFAYINELSVRSINGHADELASSGHLRQRRLERLCQKLLEGAPADDLHSAAQLADWSPPDRLVALLLPEAEAGAVALVLDRPALAPGGDLPELGPGMTVRLIDPGRGGGGGRAALMARPGPPSGHRRTGPAPGSRSVARSCARSAPSGQTRVAPR